MMERKTVPRAVMTATMMSSKAYAVFLTVIVSTLLFSYPSLAAPALDRCFDAAGTRICQDNKQKNTWYLFPPDIKIAKKKNGIPDFHLSLYHYAGRKGTGDEERFWAKGILTVTVERTRPGDALNRIKKILRRRGIFHPRFRSIPVSSSEVRLVFGDSVMEITSGARWAGSTLTLPLSEEATMILASATDKGSAHIVLMMDEKVKGVKLKEKTWEEAEVAFPQSLEIELDPKRFPSNFTRAPLEQDMGMAYTSIEVRTYDIEENLVPGLYAEDVEIALKVPGGQEVRRVHFTAATGAVQTVKFSRAADLSVPYRVRVTCIYQDGRVAEGKWMEKQGEAVLHIDRCRPANIDSFTK